MATQSNVPVKTEQPRVPATREARRWDPVEFFEEMQSDLARFLSYPFGAWPVGRNLRRMAQLPMASIPRTDMYERNGDVVVKAELPGIKKEDIDLRVEEGDLVISAERREEREVKEENWYRMERSYGSLYRRLPLPEGVQPEGIKANLSDGVLEVSFPKPKHVEGQAKRIPIG
jgi:HSP20 family protein